MTGCGRRRSSGRPCPTVSIGSANDVGRAHSNPIPSSQETSTIRLPRRNRPRSLVGDEDERVVGVLQDAVDDDVVPGQVLGHRARARDATSSGGAPARRHRGRSGPGAPAASARRPPATLRWVSTVTSWTPSASSAAIAPRAVAPKLITAARSRGPKCPDVPRSCSACSTEQ